ncbi:MAG: VCBS repeat-containing protein [Methanobacteriota archaeon]|nr:MAG: VCBS repeat-containing protein [Euryarchaeota archaeon]
MSSSEEGSVSTSNRRTGKSLSIVVFVLLSVASMPLIESAGNSIQTEHSIDLVPLEGHIVETSPDEGSPMGDIEPEPTGTIPIQVTNPSPFARPNEIVWYKLILRDLQLWDGRQVYVRNATSMTEVYSGGLPSTAKKHPSGAIREMYVVFQDDFAPYETKSYQVVTGAFPTLTGDMQVSPAYPYIYVTDGQREYEIQTSHDLSFWTQGVYVLYTNGSAVSARSGILVRVGGNQFCLDQTNFQLAWGPPAVTMIDQNAARVSIYLEYRNPTMINWGVGSIQQLYKDVDSIFANVRINIYNDRPMIETFTTKKINEKFYNHNGFVMEFTVLYAGHGEYQAIFANSNYTITKGNTLSYFWERQASSSFDLVDAGNFSSPEFGDLNDDGDFDLVMGEERGTLVYYENTGSRFAPQWTLDPTMFASLGDLGNNTAPDLTDLDNDGDMDLTIGLRDGILLYYENTGTPASPTWTNNSAMYSGIDVGDYAAPKLADLDGDGDFDLSIGESYGTIVYYENVGDSTTPIWSKNDTLFRILNTGYTKKPGLYSTPEYADIDVDGDLDFMSGTDEAPYMAVNLFINEGDVNNPNFSKLKPDTVNTVRGGSTQGDRDFSSPEMVDLDGDSDLDFAIGFSDGEIVYYENKGLLKAERGVNSMEPLENGSYRFYRDQDSNDGQYVIENYSDDFFDYYVVANPASGDAVLRYIPGFAELAYRDRYAGDEYPWAGGNVSYYPFIPEEDGYVTRGIAVSRTFYDPTAGSNNPGMMGGTYLSQTGTAAGFIQVPMTAMDHGSKEVLLLEMPYTTNYSVYDLEVERLKTDMIISGMIDFTVSSSDITLTPNEPEEGDLVIVEAEIHNQGQENATNVEVEFFDGNPDLGGTQIGSTITIPSLQRDSSEKAVVPWTTEGKAGGHDIFVRIDFSGTILEMDETNNNATRTIYVTDWFKNWGDVIQITSSHYNDLDPALIEDSNGRLWIAWHTYTTEDNFEIFTKNYSSGNWSSEELVGKELKRTSRPSLSADDNGKVWMAYSSNIIEYNNYIAIKHGKYYWSQKFDIYAKKFDGVQWLTEDQISFATVLDHSDQTPWIVATSTGDVWVTYRHTHFQFYTAGYQMYNIPYQDMNITAVMHDGVSWSGEYILDDSMGSQGWWGGPRVIEDLAGNVWVIYDSELSNVQWEIFAVKYNGTAWSAPMRLTTDPSEDMRPSACVDASGNIWVAWESTRTGNKDIFAKYYNGTDWSSDIQLTTDAGWDIKSAIAADANGNVWVAWENDRNDNKDIYLKRYNSSVWSHDIQVTTDTHSDEEVALTAGDVSGNVWIAWETDRNGHGNRDIYARMLSPSDMPEEAPGLISGLKAGVDGSDVHLSLNAPISSGLDHYLIYCSDNQTNFSFATPDHDTSGDANPLNTTWTHVGALGPLDSRMYYVIRPVDSLGRIGFNNYTIGVWKRSFDQGYNAFSLPLEPPSPTNISYYASNIPNAVRIRWLDSNGEWVTYERGVGPPANDAITKMGETYELYLTAATDYWFVGRPASMIRYHEGLGDILAIRYSLSASTVGDDITLTWTSVPDTQYYLIYRAGQRNSFNFMEPVHVTMPSATTWNDAGILSLEGEYYYMVIPMDDMGELGSSSYSVGVVRSIYVGGSSSFALVVEIEEEYTLADVCDRNPEIIGIVHMMSGNWRLHAREMPKNVYDADVKISGGYQILVNELQSVVYTSVGW